MSEGGNDVIEITVVAETLTTVVEPEDSTILALDVADLVTVLQIEGGPTGPAGPAGPQGDPAFSAYAWYQSFAATVWTIPHELGYDPAGVTVIDIDGYVLDGFGVQYLATGDTLRLSFDIPVSGTAYLS